MNSTSLTTRLITQLTVIHVSSGSQAVDMAGWEQSRGDKLIAPAWLASLARDAKVEAFAAQELQHFVAPKCGQKSARDIILNMTGVPLHFLECVTCFSFMYRHAWPTFKK